MTTSWGKMRSTHRGAKFQSIARALTAGVAVLVVGTTTQGCNPDPETMRQPDWSTSVHDRTQALYGAAYEKGGAAPHNDPTDPGEDPDEILRYPNSTLLAESTPTQKLYRTKDGLDVVLDHYRSVLASINPERSGLGECDMSDEELDGEHVTVIAAAGTLQRGKTYRVEISRVMGDVVIKVTNARRKDSPQKSKA